MQAAASSRGGPRIVAAGTWPGTGFFSATQDIRAGTTWGIQRESDTLIVHLGGPIHQLETELSGCGAVGRPPMPGEIWIVPAGERYASRARGGTVHYAEVHLCAQAFEAFTGGKASPPRVMARAGLFDPFLFRAALRLEQLARETSDISGLAAHSLTQTILLDFFSRFGSRQEPAAAAPPSLQFTRAERKSTEAFIHGNLGAPLRLEMLAARVGMTAHEFLRAFRASFHTTPAQYVIEQRLQAARELLLTTRKGIAEIAYETGFSSHAHLSAAFRRRVGASPQAYRLEYQGRRVK